MGVIMIIRITLEPITAAELFRRCVLITRVQLVCENWEDLPHCNHPRGLAACLGVTSASFIEAMHIAGFTMDQVLEVARGMPRRTGTTYLVAAPTLEAGPSPQAREAQTRKAKRIGRTLTFSVVGRDEDGRCLWDKIEDGTVSTLTMSEDEGALPGTPPSPSRFPTLGTATPKTVKARGFKELAILQAELGETEQTTQAKAQQAREVWEERQAQRAEAALEPIKQAHHHARKPEIKRALRDTLKARTEELADDLTPTPKSKQTPVQEKVALARDAAQTVTTKTSTAKTTSAKATPAKTTARPKVTGKLTLEQHLQQGNFIAIDIENTGSSTKGDDPDRVIELGIVAFRGWKEAKGRVWRFNPEGKRSNRWALDTHKIQDRELLREPLFKEHAQTIYDILKWAGVVVAHNLKATDKRFLKFELERAGLGWPDVLDVDTLPLSKEIHGTKRKGGHGLAVMTAHYGIDQGNHHAALDDARACGLLWCAMAPQLREIRQREHDENQQKLNQLRRTTNASGQTVSLF